MSKVVFRIKDLIERYESCGKFRVWYETQGEYEFFDEYNYYSMKILRELVQLKNKHPKSFLMACFLKKIKVF